MVDFSILLKTEKDRETGRDKETERDRERGRKRDRETEKQRKTERKGETKRERERERERERDREIERGFTAHHCGNVNAPVSKHRLLTQLQVSFNHPKRAWSLPGNDFYLVVVGVLGKKKYNNGNSCYV